MLTGDSEAAGREVAEDLEMDYVYTNLLPKDKLEQVEDFMLLERRHGEGCVCGRRY